VPHPRPAAKPQPARPAPKAPASDGISDSDMAKAVPLKQYLQQHRPSASDQYNALSGAIAKSKPEVDSARQASEALARQTAAMQKQLVDTAARIEFLENQKLTIDATVVRLSADYARLSADFARDRVSVSRLLGVLERLQHDVPPAMAVRPDDALAASRSAMLIGASLPRVYQDAAALARRIETLQRARTELVRRRAEATENAMALRRAHVDLDRLLAQKRAQADAAAARYGVLKTRLDTIASQAGSLQTLLQRVAQARAASSPDAALGTVNAALRGRPGWLAAPVVGPYKAGGIGVDGVGGTTAPGITYATLSGATVVAPADGKIVYAGPLGKAGRVLILELGAGYDAILTGMDRLDVRTNEWVLAGEPVGAMPKFDHESRLYFELRLKGRGISPAPFVTVALRKAR
jgi:murein hydrolase activator